MQASIGPPLLYAAANAVFWVGLLPAVLLYGGEVPLADLWRPAPLIVGAGIVAAGGFVLVFGPALTLYRQGVPLVRVTPGPGLVTDGWYGRMRHPQHVGMLLLALAPPIAIDDIWLWVVAAGAAAWLVAGREPLEERHLLEEFEDDFLEYRAAVPRWVPKLGD